jgi:ketosteroid isomerase-like protein
MDALERLIAKDEIRDLAHRYSIAMDSRDLDALVALFVDDVRVGRDRHGRQALREDFDRQLRTIGISILMVANHVIDFDDDDNARGIVYCKAEIQDGERFITQAIRYEDRYEKRSGHWHFVRRKHLLFYGRESGENPLQLPPANWPEHHSGKGTLPESQESWQRFWGTKAGES